MKRINKRRMIRLAASLLVFFAVVLSAAGQQPGVFRPPSGQPDVLILVCAMPDGQDKLGLTYPDLVAHARVQRDVASLQAATGWHPRNVKITDAPPPVRGAREKMTSVEFTVSNAVPRQAHYFAVEPIVDALRSYPHLVLTYFVGSGFQFEGLREYADNHVQITLDQHGAAYTYQILIHDRQFQKLNLPTFQPAIPDTRSAQTDRKLNLWLVALVALAAVAVGSIVYAALVRNT